MVSRQGLDIVEGCFSAEKDPAILPAALGEIALYPKGSIIFIEGDSPRGLFALREGRARLSVRSSRCGGSPLRIVDAGEILGLSATVSGKPYEATAEALDACTVRFVDRDTFLTFLGENSDACLRILRRLNDHYHRAFQQLRVSVQSRSAAQRLAEFLLRWCAESGEETAGGICVSHSPTHDQIGRLIGTSRETVTRLFADFKGKGLIRVEDSLLVILDPAALESVSRHDSSRYGG